MCIHTILMTATGSETSPSYAPRSSRFGSEPPSVEDDVDVWRYAINRELHARNDDNDSLWVDWVLRLANSERHWNCTAHFRYRGSIEYRDTWDSIVIVAPISGIAQHYCIVLHPAKHLDIYGVTWLKQANQASRPADRLRELQYA